MTQGEIERLSTKTEKIFSELEIRIMDDIVRRIKENGISTASADWQISRLQQLGKSEADIKTWIQGALKASDEEMKRIFSDEAYREYYGHGHAYKLGGMKQIPFDENIALQQLLEAARQQLQGEYENLAGSMGFALKDPITGKMKYSPLMDYYRSTMDQAVIDIHSGAFDYNTVLKRVINQMTASGLRWIDYDSGHRDRVNVAARRAVLTGFRQVQGKINEQVAAQLGTDKYEVSYHVGARPSHQPWQGKVWSMQQLKEVCGLGAVDGLCGANCYHDYKPFPPGSIRAYTDEQLKEMQDKENTPRDYNGKSYTTYEALQQQRKMERNMRAQRQKIKLLEAGEADENEITLAKAKYQGQMHAYKTFSEKMKLPEQMQRVYMDGHVGGAAGKAIPRVPQKRPVDSTDKLLKERIPQVMKESESRMSEEERIRKELLSRKYEKLSLEEFKKMHHTIDKEERKTLYGRSHFSGYINSSNARKLNKLLRDGSILPKDYQEISNTLSEVIKKNSVEKDIIVTRYVSQDALESITGIPFPKSPGLLSGKEGAERYWADIEKLKESIEVGHIYVEKGFLSTSGVFDKNVMSDKKVQLVIKTPKGTNAYITTNNKESEIIFGIGTKLEITNVNVENNRTATFKIILECLMR